MVIIKKGNYYYLKFSWRKEGKIITKEKYLGKSIPRNIKEIEQSIKEESKKQLYEALDNIKDNFQKEWKKTPESSKQQEKREIAIAFTYNTNAIEGSTITLEETREIVIDKTAPNKPLSDIRETEAHFNMFLKMLDMQGDISKKMLLHWHNAIFRETKRDIAGRYRDFLVRVGPYLAPDWQDVEKLMKRFFRFVRETKAHPVELAARAHYQFEKIHPFGDGNGRIGRIMMNYILWHNEYPLLIIEHTKRRAYYKALNRDEDGFVAYFIRRYMAVHKRRFLHEEK